jgi:iron complex outermembrane receptor protein
VKKLIFTVLVLASGFLTAVGQFGTIKGRVLTTDGGPAGFVNITLPELGKGTITAENGAFLLKNVPAGRVALVISHAGMQTLQQMVNVEAGQLAELRYVLNESSEDLQKVIVNGNRVHQQPVSIGKADINPMDLPQSAAVIGQSTIRDQQANRLSDVIRNVNGVYLSTTRASTQENFSARGYALGANNIFKNGTRVNSGAMPEMGSLERVEVLKGSTAILYGNVAPGGIINMITKQPKFRRGGELSVRSGSFGLLKPSFDIYGPLSASVAYRVNGSFETADSYRDFVHSDRYYINPSFLFKLGARTEILVETDYLYHKFTPDFGIGSVGDKQIAPLARNTFLGVPWQTATTRQATYNVNLKHRFNEQWSLSATAAYQLYNRDYYSTERIQIRENGDWRRPLGRTRTNEDYVISDVNVSGKFNTGIFGHQLLAGVDAERYLTKNYGFDQPAIYDTINIFNPSKYIARTDIPVANEIRVVTTPVYRTGAYIQDLISISPKIKLLAGLRWSYQEGRPADSLNLLTGVHAAGRSKIDKAFSPRVGLVYRPTEEISLFGSYANSFSVNSGVDIYGNVLEPSIIDQIEAGVKTELIEGKLSANLTAYRIINNNLAQTARFKADGTENNDPAIKALAGQTTSDGLELDITSEPVQGLSLVAGYSHNYMRYTNIEFRKGNFVQGERLVNTPSHTANASAFYSFSNTALKGLRLGATVVYIGKRFGGWNNTVVDAGTGETTDRLIAVDDFTTIDLSAGYCIGKVSLLAKLSNVANTLNYYVHENYSINPIAPRQLIATLSYRF